MIFNKKMGLNDKNNLVYSKHYKKGYTVDLKIKRALAFEKITC